MRALLQDDDDEDDDEQDTQRQGGNEAEDMMVFEGTDEVQPAYEPPPKKEVLSEEHCRLPKRAKEVYATQ